MLVLVEEGNPENPEKNPRKARTNNRLNPHMKPGQGLEPGRYFNHCTMLAHQTGWHSMSRRNFLLKQLAILKGTYLQCKNMPD